MTPEPKTIVPCDGCGKDFLFRTASVKKNRKADRPLRCSNCLKHKAYGDLIPPLGDASAAALVCLYAASLHVMPLNSFQLGSALRVSYQAATSRIRRLLREGLALADRIDPYAYWPSPQGARMVQLALGEPVVLTTEEAKQVPTLDLKQFDRPHAETKPFRPETKWRSE